MTGKERRNIILQLAAANGGISVRELTERFQVSRMTIHRDIRMLGRTGQLKRIHGGALPGSPAAQILYDALCSACHTAVKHHQRYRHQLPAKQQTLYCCAGCGLKAQLQQPGPGEYYATDLISGKSIPAEDAYFLIRSSSAPCCQPSILTFADELDAANFRSGFGGVLGRLPKTLAFLRTEQNLRHPN
ncbi:MAG: DeoR family transcriptional regulator [Desulfuromonadales bacterium]|nr:DeoR family transcriptional regulator [Desulfuromonadales bacterium]